MIKSVFILFSTINTNSPVALLLVCTDVPFRYMLILGIGSRVSLSYIFALNVCEQTKTDTEKKNRRIIIVRITVKLDEYLANILIHRIKTNPAQRNL